MNSLLITTKNYSFKARLYDTPTAHRIISSLPMKGETVLWGNEIYFTTPLTIPIEANAREILEPGELAFWPMGSAFCIFFGTTPASTTEKPQAYSPVNVFGIIESDLSSLHSIKQGEPINISIN